MRACLLIAAAVVSVGLLLPSAAGAQSAQPTDPEASTPSGAIYQIPVEGARRDAAPHAKRQTGGASHNKLRLPAGGAVALAGGSGGGGAGGGGAAAARGGGNGGPGAAGSGGSSGDSLYRSENNFGSSAHIPGLKLDRGGATSGANGQEANSANPEQDPAISSSRRNGGGPSTLGMALLIVGIVAVAAATAAIAVRARRLSG